MVFIKKAGTISCALSLMAVGILGLMAQTGKFVFIPYIGSYMIPAFFVLVGLDVIITARRFDSGSVNYGLILFTFFVVLMAAQFYAGGVDLRINREIRHIIRPPVYRQLM